METSTPMRKDNNLRRRTLLKITETKADELSSSIPTIHVEEQANDDSERVSRRSFIEMQRRISLPQTNQSPGLNDSVRFNGEQEIKDHFQICTKLHAENKITPRVAWQLHIIDLLRVVSKKQNSDTLQIASTSLDIGAKVYSLRVDDIHAEGLKLASSMARLAKKDPIQETEREGNEEQGPAEQEAGPAKRKKRKLRYDGGPKNTIAKDSKGFLAPLPKLESVFFSSRIDSNLGTVQNLCTNRLPTDKSCTKFMVLSKEKAWPSPPDEAVTEAREVHEFSKEQLRNIFDHNGRISRICAPFENFVLDKEDDEEHRNSLTHEPDDVVVFDNEGIPLPELDGSIHDIFNDNDYNDDEEDSPLKEDFEIQQMQHEIRPAGDLVAVDESVRRSEYSYNNILKLNDGKFIDQIWAGPSHWKLKFIRRSRPRYSGVTEVNQEGLKAKKKKHEPQLIDLTDLLKDVDVESYLDNMKAINVKKKLHPANKVTLPLPDASCIAVLQDLYELMMKPGTIPVSKKDVNTTDATENVIVDNELENEDVDPVDDNMDHIEMDHDYLDHGSQEKDMGIEKQQELLDDNLVDAPEYVPRAYVPYALQAKKMDMKKLKTHIWQILTHSSLEEKVSPITFSKMFQELPDVLPQSMKKELSCPLAFAALLHLCNDQTLKLTQHAGYRDFDIESHSIQ